MSLCLTTSTTGNVWPKLKSHANSKATIETSQGKRGYFKPENAEYAIPAPSFLDCEFIRFPLGSKTPGQQPPLHYQFRPGVRGLVDKVEGSGEQTTSSRLLWQHFLSSEAR